MVLPGGHEPGQPSGTDTRPSRQCGEQKQGHHCRFSKPDNPSFLQENLPNHGRFVPFKHCSLEPFCVTVMGTAWWGAIHCLSLRDWPLPSARSPRVYSCCSVSLCPAFRRLCAAPRDACLTFTGPRLLLHAGPGTAGSVISLLRTTHNLKCMNQLFLEFPPS